MVSRSMARNTRRGLEDPDFFSNVSTETCQREGFEEAGVSGIVIDDFHVMVIDRNGNVLGESELSSRVATVEVTPRKTGAYMVLMRADVRRRSLAETPAF